MTATAAKETAEHDPAAHRVDSRLKYLQRRLVEAFDDLWDSFVDPAEAVCDVDGTPWTSLGGGSAGGGDAGMAFLNEQQLAQIRDQCRALAVANEFAINGHENRISYIVGSGHAYRAVARRGSSPDQALLQDVQAVLDEFVRLNRWHQRQQEIVHRKDRDGECFLRLFPAADGSTRVRFVEPAEIATPSERSGDPSASFGVQTDPDDVETVVGYWIGGRLVDADQIQHRKANVDANVKRGLPLFFPVRKNLRRAEKLLRNMSVVAEIQSAIAIIRKHQAVTAAGLADFVAAGADLSVANSGTGRTSHFRRYAPGTILDAAAGTDYQFPAAGIDAARYVTVLQAELRAIASRLVMPEFMLSSDASNANYSSTMVAEGPAVKMFDRLQHDMLEDDIALLWRVLSHAATIGRLPSDALANVDIQGIPPRLAVRDRLKEAQADQILVRNRAMSVQTMSIRNGLDPEQEEVLSRQHAIAP
ncbi:MAG: phage portal protein [Planctomycetaceae bacterium]|nr:phage portal protein [Planctomycetaceae bacterium]